MKKTFLLAFLFVLCLSLLAFQCDDDDSTTPTREEEQIELNTLKSEIETLANTTACNEDTECKSIGFGSKPCGGPWSYLIYSTSIDTQKLEDLVESYNKKEDLLNKKWGIVSDCSLAQQPTSITCENNICTPVF